MTTKQKVYKAYIRVYNRLKGKESSEEKMETKYKKIINAGEQSEKIARL